MPKAMLVKKLGPPEESLSFEEVPFETPTGSQVSVKVKAIGVAFPDTLIVQGKYQFKPSLPFSPGGEFSGIVHQVGDKVDSSRFQTGDRVVAMTGWGAYREQVIVDESQLMKVPDSMSFESASSFTMNYGTTIYALKDRAELKPGETLLVLGAAGGTGTAAIEIGKAMGAKVIAAASSSEKLELCKKLGADYLINYQESNLRGELKELKLAPDVVYDPVGGNYAESAIRSLNWKGRYLVIGFTGGDIPAIPLNLPLLKGASIVGVFWGNFVAREPENNDANMKILSEWFSEGKIKPYATERWPLKDAAKALRAMMDRKLKGKGVLIVDESGDESSTISTSQSKL